MGVMTTLPWGRPLTREDLDQVPWIDADVELVDGSVVLSRQRAPFTRDDRDNLPEDGRRHELIDGTLVMTPSPVPKHQFLLARLFRLLDEPCPDTLMVLFAPLDVTLAEGTVVVPDLIVAGTDDFSEKDLPTPPLLAVEILSPSTRHIDLGRKRDAYERAGVPSYWVIDPATGEFIAWHLGDDGYAEITRIHPGQEWRAELPFPVTIQPAELIRGTTR